MLATLAPLSNSFPAIEVRHGNEEIIARNFLELLDIASLNYLIKSKQIVLSADIQAYGYTFVWCLANVVFKHTLAVIASEKGDEADFDEYFSALGVIASMVH